MHARRPALAALFALTAAGACSQGDGFASGGPGTGAGSSGETGDATTGATAVPTTGAATSTAADPDSTGSAGTTIEPTDTGSSTGDTGETELPTGRVDIGFWCGPPAAELTAARFDEIAAAGFTFVGNACDGTTYTPEYNLKMIELAHAVGLTAVITDARGLAAATGSDVDANLDALIADYAAQPGLAAYHLVDEPGAAAFPNLAAAVAGIRARDPAHPGIINLLPDYASLGQLGTPSYDAYVGTFLEQVAPDIYTYDHYNFLDNGSDGPTFFANLAVARAHTVATGIPFGQYIQAISYNGHRATTGAEKRWAALHTLAYGGTGVMYFTYWTPPQTLENFGDGIIGANGLPTAQYADVTAINHTLTTMGRYLGAATSSAVFHNGLLDAATAPRPPGAPVYVPSPAPITVGLFTIDDGAYALLVNRDHDAAVETDVLVSSAGAPTLMDPASGELAPIAGAVQEADATKFHLGLAAGDGALLHLPGPLPPGPPGAEAYVGTVRSDAGSLDVVDARFGAQRLRGAGWDDCPAGTTNVGKQFDADGFWLCARADLATRVFHVGNVVKDAGNLVRVENGVVTPVGPAGWDTCPTGSMIGRRFESDGFWLCMDP